MGLALKIVLSAIGVLVVVGISVGYFVINKKERRIKDMRENPPKFFNFARSDFTRGYSSGLLIKETPTKNGCIRFEYLPTGYEKGEGKKKPGVQTVIYHKDKVRRFARGELEPEVEHIWGIGTDASQLPKKLKDTWLGEKLDQEGQVAFLKKTFGESVPTAQQALATMMRNWSAVGVTSEFVTQFKEMKREVEKFMASQQSQKISLEDKKE